MFILSFCNVFSLSDVTFGGFRAKRSDRPTGHGTGATLFSAQKVAPTPAIAIVASSKSLAERRERTAFLKELGRKRLRRLALVLPFGSQMTHGCLGTHGNTTGASHQLEFGSKSPAIRLAAGPRRS